MNASFGGDPEVKARHVALAASLSAGYWAELGVPEAVVVLQRRLRALLDEDAVQMWPADRLLVAIPVGRDLSGAFSRFVAWLLSDPRRGVGRDLDPGSPAQRAVRRVATLYSLGGYHRQWLDAGSAAEDAAAHLADVYPHGAQAAWAAAWAVEHVIHGRAGDGVDELLDAAFAALHVGPVHVGPVGDRWHAQVAGAWANVALSKLSDVLSRSPLRDPVGSECEDSDDDLDLEGDA